MEQQAGARGGRDLSRRTVAQRLDIPLEMARHHGIPPFWSADQLAAFLADPPAWYVQSRANRTGKRPVWVELRCTICGTSETLRPKKWWPEFSMVSCSWHGADELPRVPEGARRREVDGIGAFVGIVDEPTS